MLATGATATTHLLPPVMADLRLRHPGIDLRVITGNTVDLIPGLLDGSTDLGLVTAPVRHRHLRTRPFFHDRLVRIAPPGQAPATRTIRRATSKAASSSSMTAAAPSGAPPTPGSARPTANASRVSDIASAEAMTAFVAAGLGWAIVSEVAAREAAVAGRIELFGLEPPLFRDLVLVWRADRATRPVIAAALAVFTSHARVHE